MKWHYFVKCQKNYSLVAAIKAYFMIFCCVNVLDLFELVLDPACLQMYICMYMYKGQWDVFLYPIKKTVFNRSL